jgi:hypothetical protein
LVWFVTGVPSHWWGDAFSGGGRSILAAETHRVTSSGGRVVELDHGPLTVGDVRELASGRRSVDPRELSDAILGQGWSWVRERGGDTRVTMSVQELRFVVQLRHGRGWPLVWRSEDQYLATDDLIGPMPERLAMPGREVGPQERGWYRERQYWRDTTGSIVASHTREFDLSAWLAPFAGGVLAGWFAWVALGAGAWLAGRGWARRVRGPGVAIGGIGRESRRRARRARWGMAVLVGALACAGLGLATLLVSTSNGLRYPVAPPRLVMSPSEVTLADLEAMERGDLSVAEFARGLHSGTGDAPDDRVVILGFEERGTTETSMWPPMEHMGLLRFDTLRRVGDDGLPSVGWRGFHWSIGTGWFLAWWATRGGTGASGIAIHLATAAWIVVTCAMAWLLGRAVARATMAWTLRRRRTRGLCVACGYPIEARGVKA